MSDHLSSAASHGSTKPVRFDWNGVVLGARRILPVAFSVCAYGLAFGVLARQVGLSTLEVFLMTQLIVLGLWAMPLSIAAILLTTLIVNLRNLLMGAALSPWFSRLAPLKAYTTIFLLADEN
jgi:predicted branched-subunit amino acid permease